MRQILRGLAVGFAVTVLCSHAVLAQGAASWPNRVVKIVVPYPAGGATDSIARLVAAKLQQQLGQGFVIENKGGAGGNIGADAVAKATPDGYTILFNINGHAIAPAIYAKLSYSPDDDFIRVSQIASTSTILVVNPDVPAKNFQELIALAKAKPGVLNYGSTGIGNSLHLTMELIKQLTQTDIQMVPFQGDPPLFQSLFRNDIQIALVPSSITRAHVEAGAVRALGITTLTRSTTMPDVPTLDEGGLKGFENRGWMGLFLPKGTPQDIVEKLARETRIAVQSAELRERFAGLELEPVGSTPEEFEKIYRADRIKFEKIVKDAKIQVR